MSKEQNRQFRETLMKMSKQEVMDLLFTVHLEMHGGVKQRAAESLGISERTLYYWIKKNQDG